MNEISKKTEKNKRKERLIEKHCMFVGEDDKRCKTIFFGTGKSKFCKLHRQPKFRKIIDRDKIIAKKKATIENTANFIIRHKNVESTEIIRNCDCCGSEYKIVMYPSTFVYSKYCEEHRNEWKRNFYLSKQNSIAQ